MKKPIIIFVGLILLSAYLIFSRWSDAAKERREQEYVRKVRQTQAQIDRQKDGLREIKIRRDLPKGAFINGWDQESQQNIHIINVWDVPNDSSRKKKFSLYKDAKVQLIDFRTDKDRNDWYQISELSNGSDTGWVKAWFIKGVGL